MYNAIVEFGLMTTTPEIAASEIVARVMDLLVLTSSAGKIISINKRVTDILCFTIEELQERPV